MSYSSRSLADIPLRPQRSHSPYPASFSSHSTTVERPQVNKYRSVLTDVGSALKAAATGAARAEEAPGGQPLPLNDTSSSKSTVQAAPPTSRVITLSVSMKRPTVTTSLRFSTADDHITNASGGDLRSLSTGKTYDATLPSRVRPLARVRSPQASTTNIPASPTASNEGSDPPLSVPFHTFSHPTAYNSHAAALQQPSIASNNAIVQSFKAVSKHLEPAGAARLSLSSSPLHRTSSNNNAATFMSPPKPSHAGAWQGSDNTTSANAGRVNRFDALAASVRTTISSFRESAMHMAQATQRRGAANNDVTVHHFDSDPSGPMRGAPGSNVRPSQPTYSAQTANPPPARPALDANTSSMSNDTLEDVRESLAMAEEILGRIPARHRQEYVPSSAASEQREVPGQYNDQQFMSAHGMGEFTRQVEEQYERQRLSPFASPSPHHAATSGGHDIRSLAEYIQASTASGHGAADGIPDFDLMMQYLDPNFIFQQTQAQGPEAAPPSAVDQSYDRYSGINESEAGSYAPDPESAALADAIEALLAADAPIETIADTILADLEGVNLQPSEAGYNPNPADTSFHDGYDGDESYNRVTRTTSRRPGYNPNPGDTSFHDGYDGDESYNRVTRTTSRPPSGGSSAKARSVTTPAWNASTRVASTRSKLPKSRVGAEPTTSRQTGFPKRSHSAPAERRYEAVGRRSAPAPAAAHVNTPAAFKAPKRHSSWLSKLHASQPPGRTHVDTDDSENDLPFPYSFPEAYPGDGPGYVTRPRAHTDTEDAYSEARARGRNNRSINMVMPSPRAIPPPMFSPEPRRPTIPPLMFTPELRANSGPWTRILSATPAVQPTPTRTPVIDFRYYLSQARGLHTGREEELEQAQAQVEQASPEQEEERREWSMHQHNWQHFN